MGNTSKKPTSLFLKLFGSNVNVGNISIDDVIPLETLRLGLRGDTFLLFYQNQLISLFKKILSFIFKKNMKQISSFELKNLIDSKAEFQLVDVREDYEFEEANLNGELIPMGDVIDNVEKISRDKQVVIHCRSGKRSANVITTLENKFGFTNLYNLEGGILSYIEQFGL